MGIFDGLFGASDDANPAAFSLKDKMADPTFLAGLQILSNSMVKRPLTQQVSPFEGVAPLLLKAGEDKQTRDALTMLLKQSGYDDATAARMAKNPAIAKMAIDQKQHEKLLNAYGNAPDLATGLSGSAMPTSSAPRADATPTTPATPAAPIAPGMDGILQLARKDSGDNYNALTYKRDKTPGGTADLENMTLAQVFDYQDKMPSLGHASTAVGAYQTIKPTLQAAVSALGLDPATTKFDKPTQDAIAAQIVKQRGYDDFAAGKLPADKFAANLSKEWAILQGPNGRGAYDGVNGNRASVPASSVMAALQPPATASAYAPTAQAATDDGAQPKPVQVASSDPTFAPNAAAQPASAAPANPAMNPREQMRQKELAKARAYGQYISRIEAMGGKPSTVYVKAFENSLKLASPTDDEIKVMGAGFAPGTSGAQEVLRNAIPNSQPASIREADFLEHATDAQRKAFMDAKQASKVENKTVINNAVNPLIKGGGDDANEAISAGRNAVSLIQNLHEARGELDKGIISGFGADKLESMQSVGAQFFGVDPSKIVNTQTFRAIVGDAVLKRAKDLGANPSNEDAKRINAILGGNTELNEGTLRKILDFQEKMARRAIQNANSTVDQYIEAYGDDPDTVRAIKARRVKEPGAYTPPERAEPKAEPKPASGKTGGYPEGTIVKNPTTGERMIKQNGNWVPAQ